MTYQRMIPRDLFNDANLLKCYGQLYIKLTESGIEHSAKLLDDLCQDGFNIEQNPNSGATSLNNVILLIDNMTYWLERPLNSRDSWPLYVVGNDADGDTDPIPVFDDNGNLSSEMIELITKSD